MCLYHEGWYRLCADYLFGLIPEQCDIFAYIGENLGAEFPEEHRRQCEVELKRLLDDWHERGMMRPDAASRARGYVPMGIDPSERPPPPRGPLPWTK